MNNPSEEECSWRTRRSGHRAMGASHEERRPSVTNQSENWDSARQRVAGVRRDHLRRLQQWHLHDCTGGLGTGRLNGIQPRRHRPAARPPHRLPRACRRRRSTRRRCRRQGLCRNPGTRIGGSVSVAAPCGAAPSRPSSWAMLQPFEDATGITVNYTGTRDVNHRPDDRRRLGRPARPRRPAGPGADGPVRAGRQAPATCRSVLDVPTYTSQTAPALVNLGHGRRQVVGRLH